MQQAQQLFSFTYKPDIQMDDCILNLELDLAQDRFRISTTWSVAFKKTTSRQLQRQHLPLIRRWEHCGRASYFAYTMNLPLHRLRHTATPG